MKLNIQLFASGTVDNFTKVKGTTSATLQGKIEWSSVGDATTNKSIVTTKLYARRTDNYTSTPTSGKNWGGKVKVGNNAEHKFTTLSKNTSVASSWVLFATYTDEIEHDIDGTKTITISGSVTGATGTSLEGKTSSGSKTFALDQLHKLPDEVTFDILEVNEELINAGVSNDVFIKDLSIKSFNISGNTYDNATVKEYGILNRIVPYGTTTLPLIIDFSQNEILTDLTYVTKVPITGRIIDSYDTAGYSETLLFDYVPYNKIKLVETSTTAKRNGQTSGKVRLNINGNLYNGIIGNVDQSTYKPIVKYKFWQTGTEEPTTYDYEIPSDNITIENGVFSVSNYEIGSSVETDINWFNPENAYKVKIYVEDNFTSYESQEKSIAVGEATWTEYKNRVDFKAITTKGAKVTSSIVSPNQPTNGEEVWIQARENLFDKNTITPDTFVDEVGDLITDTDTDTWNLSDYILVEPNVEYTYSGIATPGTRPYFGYYDINKNYISSIKQVNTTTTITIPENVYYIRCSVFDNDLHSFRFEKCSSSEIIDKSMYFKKTDGTYEEFYSKPVILYSNPTGVATTITLNESAINFRYLVIMYYSEYGQTVGGCRSVMVYEPNGKVVELNGDYDNGEFLYMCNAKYTINGTTMTKNAEVRWRFTPSSSTTKNTRTNATANMKIYKVVGYR